MTTFSYPVSSLVPNSIARLNDGRLAIVPDYGRNQKKQKRFGVVVGYKSATTLQGTPMSDEPVMVYLWPDDNVELVYNPAELAGKVFRQMQNNLQETPK